jgi:tRNA(Ile)-lysidine synthase
MADSSLHPLEARFADLWPAEEWHELTVLLAVSGGADSVALLRAMTALKTGGAGRLCVAHFNHQLREDAEEDEQFVRALCKRFNLLCETGRNDVGQLAASSKEGLEETARRVRYAFLNETAGSLGARFVVTAHTADDQAETILHRIVRGTGIVGLSGMSRSRPFGPATLFRPLLTIRRQELLEYLSDLGQPFREDPSNADRRFTRNRIRQELLPLLAKQYNSGVSEALLRLGLLAGEVQEVVEGLVAGLHEKAVKYETAASVEIDAAQLSGQPRYLLRELLLLVWRRQSWPMQAMGFAQWDQLAQMFSQKNYNINAATVRQTFPGNIQAEMRDGVLRLYRWA